MVSKARIIDELGERSLLLPEYVNRALAANDRVKYYFTLLQTARAHAEHPDLAHPDLARERAAAGIDDESLDAVIAATQRDGDGAYRVPAAERIHERILADMEQMLAPVETAASATAGADGAGGYRRRLEVILSRSRVPEDGCIQGSAIDALTRARRGEGDSVHLLVMDLHKALNALQAGLSQESIDGARAYNVSDADRPLIQAFMAGLNRTAPLKFDHPGLGTTATRAGDRLVIQNDIGTTDAHVLVVHVQALSAVLTYTDLHIRRAAFFQSLFETFGVNWEDTRTRPVAGLEEGESYYLCVGRYDAGDADDLARYLAFLGSRIVFLIDWNRARKRLRGFVGNKGAVAVLKWAADHDYGHRAFLQLGGDQLVYEAVEHAAHTPIRYGQRLDEVLGRETVMSYLRFVLRTTAEGLLAGRSERLLRDELKAELVEHFHSTEQEFLLLAADHAGLVVDLAGTVRDALLRAPLAGGEELLQRTARRAKLWETRADELVIRVRDAAESSPGGAPYAAILSEADDIADGLEEAAFLLTLLPAMTPAAEHLAPLQALAELLVTGGRELVKCIESAGAVARGATREDLHDFLEAVDRIAQIEHRTDDAEREVTAALLRGAPDARQLHLCSQIARTLEEAADALGRCGFMLRDHVMREVMLR